jgi:hypothetical protein
MLWSWAATTVADNWGNYDYPLDLQSSISLTMVFVMNLEYKTFWWFLCTPVIILKTPRCSPNFYEYHEKFYHHHAKTIKRSLSFSLNKCLNKEAPNNPRTWDDYSFRDFFVYIQTTWHLSFKTHCTLYTWR